METLSYPVSTGGPSMVTGPPSLSMTATVMGIMDDDCDENTDFSTVTSNMAAMLQQAGGKSRRKQSKPIRVFSNDPNEVAMETEAAAVAGTGQRGGMPEGASEAMETDIDDERSRASDHYENGDGSYEDDESFPTKYHQLGQEFHEAAMGQPLVIEPEDPEEPRQQQNGSPPPVHYSPSDEEIPLNPTEEQLAGTPVDRSKPNGSFIFHPDAYCELCDREFCNKYFLKTHKANKHGVYENGNSDSPITGPPLFPSSVPSMIPFSAHSSSPNHKERSPSLPPAGQSPHPSSSPSSMPPLSQALHTSQNGISSTSIPMPSLVPPPGTPTKMQIDPLTGKPKPASDMEDYCEICQKHFCNKYYLKKHKQDVHGIMPDTPPQKRSRPSGSTPSRSPPSGMPLPHHLAMMNGGLPPGAMNGAMANLMFINPFAPPLMPMPGAGLPLGFPGMPGVPSLPGTPGPLPGPPTPVSQPEAGQKTPPSSSTSPGSKPTESSDGAPTSEDAYCEICRKEFCNRYFLRIHKANKHGIYMPEDPPGSGQPPPPFMLPLTPDGLPLPMPPVPENARKENDESRSESDKSSNESRESSEYTCKLCNKSYPNQYALRVHQINAHDMAGGDPSKPVLPEMAATLTPKPLSIEQHFNNLASSMQPLEGSGDPSHISGTMFGNMIAAKLADRVVCEICNKEVCNKYFLRTHKMKVHGIQPEQLDRERDREREQREREQRDREHRDRQRERERERERAESERMQHSLPPSHLGHMAMPQEGPTDLSKKPPPPQPPTGDEKRPPDQELLKMGIDPEAYCEICKKEFCSKYFLRTHKMNIHGIKTHTDSPSKPLAPKSSQPLGLPHIPSSMHSLVSLPMSMSMNSHPSAAMNNLVAGSLPPGLLPPGMNTPLPFPFPASLLPHPPPRHDAPRHDIPHPDLRHELPRHEAPRHDRLPIEGPRQEGPRSEGPRPEGPRNEGSEAPPTSRPDSSPHPRHEGTPERHSPSRHSPGGHQRDPSRDRPSSRPDVPHMMSNGPPRMPGMPTMPGMPLGPGIPFGPPGFPSPFGPGGLGLRPDGPGFGPGGDSPNSAWKWKEPVNATRVMCELCNKELCNKYFLKTHMLNKHGMQYDHLTGISTPLPGGIPKDADKDGVKSERRSPNSNSNSSTNSNTNFTTSGPVPSFAEAMFRDSISMAEAMYKDSVIKSTFDSPVKGGYVPLTLLPPGKENRPDSHWGGLQSAEEQMVSAKIWQVPASIKQESGYGGGEGNEHNNESSSDERGVRSIAEFLHKCDICEGMFSEQMALQLHKLRDHGNPDQMDIEQRQALTTSAGQNIRKKYAKHKLRTTRRWRRLGACGATIGAKVKSAIVNHIANQKKGKKYRCAHCSERFATRSFCHAHIRAEHPNMRLPSSQSQSDQSESTNSPRRLPGSSGTSPRSLPHKSTAPESQSNGLPVAFATPEQQSQIPADAYVMQSFTLEHTGAHADPEAPNFARSVVYLPVLQKIAQPVTVTFTLSPTEQ